MWSMETDEGDGDVVVVLAAVGEESDDEDGFCSAGPVKKDRMNIWALERLDMVIERDVEKWAVACKSTRLF